jgi:hypothetical protein
MDPQVKRMSARLHEFFDHTSCRGWRTPMIELKLIDGRYIVTLDKGCIVVLTKDEFIQGLRRGTWWKRGRAKATHLAKAQDHP